jgi:hypothetical protein
VNLNQQTHLDTLQKLYDQFHAEMVHELAAADNRGGRASWDHYARANAYTNARDAVMRAARHTLEPAE